MNSSRASDGCVGAEGIDALMVDANGLMLSYKAAPSSCRSSASQDERIDCSTDSDDARLSDLAGIGGAEVSEMDDLPESPGSASGARLCSPRSSETSRLWKYAGGGAFLSGCMANREKSSSGVCGMDGEGVSDAMRTGPASLVIGAGTLFLCSNTPDDVGAGSCGR